MTELNQIQLPSAYQGQLNFGYSLETTAGATTTGSYESYEFGETKDAAAVTAEYLEAESTRTTAGQLTLKITPAGQQELIKAGLLRVYNVASGRGADGVATGLTNFLVLGCSLSEFNNGKSTVNDAEEEFNYGTYSETDKLRLYTKPAADHGDAWSQGVDDADDSGVISGKNIKIHMQTGNDLDEYGDPKDESARWLYHSTIDGVAKPRVSFNTNVGYRRGKQCWAPNDTNHVANLHGFDSGGGEHLGEGEVPKLDGGADATAFSAGAEPTFGQVNLDGDAVQHHTDNYPNIYLYYSFREQNARILERQDPVTGKVCRGVEPKVVGTMNASGMGNAGDAQAGILYEMHSADNDFATRGHQFCDGNDGAPIDLVFPAHEFSLAVHNVPLTAQQLSVTKKGSESDETVNWGDKGANDIHDFQQDAAENGTSSSVRAWNSNGDASFQEDGDPLVFSPEDDPTVLGLAITSNKPLITLTTRPRLDIIEISYKPTNQAFVMAFTNASDNSISNHSVASEETPVAGAGVKELLNHEGVKIRLDDFDLLESMEGDRAAGAQSTKFNCSVILELLPCPAGAAAGAEVDWPGEINENEVRP